MRKAGVAMRSLVKVGRFNATTPRCGRLKTLVFSSLV